LVLDILDLMRVTFQNCLHCGTQYSYQLSGAGAPDTNSGTWCPECLTVVRQALSGLPRKYSKRLRSISEMPRYKDITKEFLLFCEKEKWARIEATKQQPRCGSCALANFFAGTTRIYPGLMELDGSDAQNIRDVVVESGQHRGRTFVLSTWRHRHEHSIQIEQEWDNIKQEWTGRSWIGQP
jgi:hypothetical protein